MNRHERRKPVVIEEKMIRTDQIVGYMCGGEGCVASFNGHRAPTGWRWLIVHASPTAEVDLMNLPGAAWVHDNALCPKCAAKLDRLLKGKPAVLSEPAAGSA